MGDKEQKIREAVQDFVTAEKLFTSVDVGNAIKKITHDMGVRNREVRDWLRSNMGKDPVLADYVSEPIDVNNGSRVAMLYRPHWKDASDYIDRNQKALGPNDLSALSPSTAAASQNATSGSASVVDDSVPSVIDSGTHVSTSDPGVKLVRKGRYSRRIQIPGDITQALGWVSGQTVDISKIKIHNGKLNSNLKVWYDGRVSIPRNVVGYGQDPVNIILKDDEIYFEKA
jgi:hypothetical protein